MNYSEEYEQQINFESAAKDRAIEVTEATIEDIEETNPALAEKLRTDLSTLIEQEADSEKLQDFYESCVEEQMHLD